jgi:hypothetical protein
VRQACLLLLLATGACTPEGARCPDERGEAPWPGARLIAAARVDDKVRIRGFSGAVPPGSIVRVAHPSDERRVHADEEGRFLVELRIAGAVQVDAGELGRATLPVRELAEAMACIPGASLESGTGSNDLVLGTCDGGLVALVAASSDGALWAAGLDGGRVPPAAVFPVDGLGRGANPWGVALDASSGRAVVTLFGQHAAALVEPCTGRLLSVANAAQHDNAPRLLELDPPLQLDAPLDADDSGVAKALVTRMLPRHPQGVAFVEERVLVSFTNLLEVGPPARFGPGLVVAFDVVDDALRAAEHMVLPFDNPQSITLDEEGRAWVSCSGVLEQGEDGWAAVSEGGLVRLAAAPLALAEVVPLGTFAPATPAFAGGALVVGSLVTSRVAHLPPGAAGLDDATTLTLGGPGVESMFSATALGGGLVGVTQFSADLIHVLDGRTGELSPWPFTAPIHVGRGGAFRGVKALATAPPSGKTAPDAAALLVLSSEVVPLRLWQVLGP